MFSTRDVIGDSRVIQDEAIDPIDQALAGWLTTTRFTQDANTLAMIRARVIENHSEEGGYVSQTSCERAYLELVAEGQIEEFRGKAADVVPDAYRTRLTAAQFNALPNSVAQARYKTDAQFRRDVDELISAGRV